MKALQCISVQHEINRNSTLLKTTQYDSDVKRLYTEKNNNQSWRLTNAFYKLLSDGSNQNAITVCKIYFMKRIQIIKPSIFIFAKEFSMAFYLSIMKRAFDC